MPVIVFIESLIEHLNHCYRTILKCVLFSIGFQQNRQYQCITLMINVITIIIINVNRKKNIILLVFGTHLYPTFK